MRLIQEIFKCMALKNYTTKVPVVQSINEIQKMLQDHGATSVLTEYEEGTGRIAAVSFRIKIQDHIWDFRMPMQWRLAQKAMIEDGNRRAINDEDYCFRVAWRITRDWIDVQMALVELKTAELQQIFLPYVVTNDGETVYEKFVKHRDKFLSLGSGE